MIERVGAFRWMAQRDRLPCGCAVGFLPDSNPDLELVHEKPQSLFNAYNEIFGEIYPTFGPEHTIEIGVKYGGSLCLWRDRLGGQVHGVEIEPRKSAAFDRHLAHQDGISVHVASGTSAAVLDLPNPDLVIDDGSHQHEDICAAKALLWNRLPTGGLYVIEDWRTDGGRPYELVSQILREMVGYWPNPSAPKGAPAKILIWRDVIVLEKGLS